MARGGESGRGAAKTAREGGTSVHAWCMASRTHRPAGWRDAHGTGAQLTRECVVDALLLSAHCLSNHFEALWGQR